MRKTEPIRGDFLFFYPSNVIDRIIAGLSGKYCHCGLYLGNDLMISARLLRGISFNKLSNYKKDFDIYRIDGITDKEVEKIIQFSLQLRGRKYDLLQLPGILFNVIIGNPKRFFCSEFLSVLCILINRIQSKHPELMTPTDLSNEPFMVKKNKGKIDL